MTSAKPALVRLLAGVAVCSLTLTACSGEEEPEPIGEPTTAVATTAGESAAPTDSAAPESSAPVPSSTISPSANLDGLKVTGEAGAKPTVTVPTPWAIGKTQTKVLIPSKNPHKLTEESRATVHYVGYNGRTGEVFDSSWERGTPTSFRLDQVVPGFRKGLSGQSVGSRVLIGMPSEDGYPDGQGEQILPGDSLIFVVDIVDGDFQEAMGETVAPAANLPVVTMGADGPELAKPSGDAPKELVVQPLIKGSGRQIADDSVILARYRSWNWADGKLAEDEWSLLQARPLNSLIPGWREGLAGQTAGSRMLLVVPPEKGFPEGDSRRGVPSGATLVYVIEILDLSGDEA